MKSWRSARLSAGLWGLAVAILLGAWGCGRDRVNPIDPNFGGGVEALSPPGNLRATGDIGRIALTWNPVASTDLAGYGVWRSTSATEGYARLGGEVADSLITTARVTYVDTLLDSGATKVYYYKVNTIDILKRSSELSVFVSAEAEEDKRPPIAPTDLSAVTNVETGNVTITWTASQADAGGQVLTGLETYRVFRSKNSQDAFVEIATVPAGETAFTDTTNLELNARYFYRLTALDGIGNESGRSGSASITTTGTGVAAPGGLRTIGRIGQIDVLWNPVSEPNLIGYMVLRSVSTQENFQPVTADTLFTTAQTEYIDTGVEPDKVYFYRLQSVVQDPERGLVRSDESPFVDGEASEDQNPPTAPSDPIVSLDENVTGAVQIDWTAPLRDSNGGDLTGLETYRIFRSEGTPNSFVQIAEVPATQTGYQDRDTELLTLYFYTVSAVDAAGNISPRAPIVTVVTPGLQVPRGVTALSGVGAIVVFWTANTDTDLIGYKLLRSDKSAGPFTAIAGDESDEFTTAQIAYVDSPLVAEETFFYRVLAVGRGGIESDTSTFVTSTVLKDETPPAPPTDVVAAVDAANLLQVNLSWTTPTTDSDGRDLTGLSAFQIFRSETTSSSFSLLTEVPAVQSTYQDTSAKAVTTYFYTIGGIDELGNAGPRSAVVGVRTGGLSSPSSVIAIGGIQRISVGWAANTETELTGYRVLRYDDPSQTSENASFETVRTGYVDSPLVAGDNFIYRVQALGTGGLESELSRFASAEVSQDNRPPTTPRDFSASLKSAQTIELRWSAPKTDQGGGDLTGLSGFRIYRAVGTTSAGFQVLQVLDGTKHSFENSGLEFLTTYIYRISAVDDNGNESALSGTISLTTSSSGASIASPTNLEAVVTTQLTSDGTQTLVRLTWTHPAEFSNFLVQRGEAGSSSTVSFSTIESEQASSPYDDTTVQAGKVYIYRVLTNLSGQLSEPSNEGVVVVPQ